jgi:superfamily II DNA or RNA helicase
VISPGQRPIAPGPEAASGKLYWNAQALVERVRREFEAAHKRGDSGGARERFFLLAGYHARTVSILRYALAARRELLARAALRNLVTLHKALHAMHRSEPDAVPEALDVDRGNRLRLYEDMIVEVLEESPTALDPRAITRRVNALDVLADASEATITRHLDILVGSGHVRRAEQGYRRTAHGYRAVNLDQAELRALLNPTLAWRLSREGFGGLSDVQARKQRLGALLEDTLGFTAETTALFEAAVESIFDSAVSSDVARWPHADLLGSTVPRYYQYEAYAIFRGYGYRGQLIEAPAGSGKTLIGMLCIQDWLRSLSHGQTVLVLVPTVNYQQQWVRELCHKPTGLRLPQHLVFTGGIAALEAARRRVGTEPCVLVLTYAALAQLGSGLGKGGFDVDAIERLLQENHVQYVLLDEVHKVVEDARSVSADVTRALVEWLRDSSLRGLIGFSGTAALYRRRFTQLGLKLVHVMSTSELIAHGYVAPFAELSVPFAFSEREQRIRDLVATYRGVLLEYAELLGGGRLRRWLAEIPLAERLALGRDVLRMYASREDQEQALTHRLSGWERGASLTGAELPLILLIQLARGWSDRELARAAAPDRQSAFEELLERLNRLRAELRELVYLPDTRRRLAAEGFGNTFDAEPLRRLADIRLSAAARQARARDGLATTFVGLLSGLTEWYLRVGEGRVGAIKAIVEAERATRRIDSVIVFDTGHRIHWETDPAVPGYGGAGGLFAELLGDSRFTPLAVLSSELYLPYDEADPLPGRIAAYIRRAIMLGELASTLFELCTEGRQPAVGDPAELRATLDGLLASYVERLPGVHARRTAFRQQVLAPLRRAVRQMGLDREFSERVRNHLNVRGHHLQVWLNSFLDYAAIAERFERASTARLEQVSGVIQRFFVVRMASGDRKQLMYDLAARIVDAEDLPINLIVVSSWARTGWNVVKPNLLIDATATRDVVAWQQLRGRAMRAHRLWTGECHELLQLLLGTHAPGEQDREGLPPDVVELFDKLIGQARSTEALDEASRSTLREAYLAAGGSDDDPLSEKVERGPLAELTPTDRRRLMLGLMLARNKVTHIYELIKASGSEPQIHYDRAAHIWTRAEAIAAKHAAEQAVDPLTGAIALGAKHAPLIYAEDPRRDVPAALGERLRAALAGADPRIVSGWIGAIGDGAVDLDAVG